MALQTQGGSQETPGMIHLGSLHRLRARLYITESIQRYYHYSLVCRPKLFETSAFGSVELWIHLTKPLIRRSGMTTFPPARKHILDAFSR